MGKTIVEKILARAGGNPNASAGDIVNAEIDFMMTNDAVGELTVEAFEERTNRRFEGAADILRERRVHPDVRFLIAPASRKVLRQAVKEGLFDVFLNAGATICNPGCSACFGGQGMLWEGEVCIGSHNRNFRARMGHRDSKAFLASPETVAVSAVTGKITDPRYFDSKK